MKQVLVITLLIAVSLTSFAQTGKPATMFFNVKDYGATGDSTHDDRAAIIKCRDAYYAAGSGAVIIIPSGKYRISDSILFNKSVRIQGVTKSGPLHNNQSGGSLEKNRLGPVEYSTVIYVTDGKSGFVFDRQPTTELKGSYVIEEITFASTIAPGSTTGGAFVVVKGMLQGTIIRDVSFYGGWIQMDVQSGYYPVITGCHFSAPRKAGLKTGNVIRTDTGDFTVTGCTFSSGTFNTASDTTRAVWWYSGGGMRIVNNKFDACEFDNAHAFVYNIYAANVIDPTSDFLITANSFENWATTAIKLQGVITPFVRHIQILGNQFAPVGSTGPAIDIDSMEDVMITDFEMRDWSGTVSAPAIKVTNSTNVLIGKGIIHSYTSNLDLTGSTGIHTDYLWNNFTIQEIATNNTLIADNLKYLSGGYKATKTGHSSGFQFFNGTIYAITDLGTVSAGSPANIINPFWIDQGITNALDVNVSGKIGLGTITSPTRKLDIGFNSTGTDGITIKNSNSGVAAREIIAFLNDANELGQIGMMSSTHATLANYTLFESTKSFRIGTDAGVSSGGSAKFEITTGGYSSSPSFTVNANGTINLSSLTTAGLVTTTSGGLLSSTAAIAESFLSISDVTTANATTSAHGFLKKLDNNAAHFINGQGSWVALTGLGGIYSGSGTLPGDVVVSGTGASLLDIGGGDGIPYIYMNPTFGTRFNNGILTKVSTISSSASLTVTDHFVKVDASGGNVTVTLPVANTVFTGGIGINYIIKRMDNSGNTVTIQRSSSDTIDGATSTTLTTQYQSINISATASTEWSLH